MYRSFDYADDLMGVDPSLPATAPIFRGAAFQQQNIDTRTFPNPTDDRVELIGDAYDPTVEPVRSLRLPADDNATTPPQAVTDATAFQGMNVTRSGNVPARIDAPGSAIQSTNDGEWYETLRPNAGFQLPLAGSDRTYVAVTGDQMGEPWPQHDPYWVAPGTRIVAEKALDIPSRLSAEPSTEQAPYTTWADAMGAWEWTGQKAAQERPIADAGPWFVDPLSDRIPTPTGAGGAMIAPQAYNLYPQPLTFRAPPTPWDQGPNADNGFYVDSGF